MNIDKNQFNKDNKNFNNNDKKEKNNSLLIIDSENRNNNINKILNTNERVENLKQKTLIKNKIDMSWENKEKYKIKNIYDKKYRNLSEPKVKKILENTSVLQANEKFYEEICSGKIILLIYILSI